MNLLQALVDAVKGPAAAGPQDVANRTVIMNMAHKAPGPQGRQLTATNPQQINATIAADGARMFQQAHPGQTYQIGQNGESYPGGVDMNFYNALMRGQISPTTSGPVQMPLPQLRGQILAGAPLLRTFANIGQNNYMPQVAPGNQYNPGSIPLQATHANTVNSPAIPQIRAYNTPQPTGFNPQGNQMGALR